MGTCLYNMIHRRRMKKKPVGNWMLFQCVFFISFYLKNHISPEGFLEKPGRTKYMYKNNYDASKVGAKIKQIRKASNMKQEELAEKLLVSVDSVSNYENGKTTCMPEHMVHICEIFNVSMDYFYFDDVCYSKGESSFENILKLLENAEKDDVERVEQMIKLFLRK